MIGTKEAKEKDFRSDITEGKRTLVAVHALHHSDKRDRLIELLASKTTDPALLAEAVAIMQEAGSIDYARAYAEKLTANAGDRLAAILPDTPARSLLVSMANWFVDRLK